MKITLEPTDKECIEDFNYHKVSLEVKSDDMELSEVFDNLIIPCLLGWGYSQSSIDKYLDENICDIIQEKK